MHNPNKHIYNDAYAPSCLDLAPRSQYERRFIEIRNSYIEKYAHGKDVLDLCCGTGAYLIPALSLVKKAAGIDFSRNMLEEFRKKKDALYEKKLILAEADASSLPFSTGAFDVVFSYASLYYVPDISGVLREIYRVLKNSGIAVIELGNYYSLNTPLSYFFHKTKGHAKPFYIPAWQMDNIIQLCGFRVLQHRVFQLLPLYVTFKKAPFLFFLSGDFWKKIVSIEVNGKMLDEIVSGFWPVRYFAFRHLFVIEKP